MNSHRLVGLVLLLVASLGCETRVQATTADPRSGAAAERVSGATVDSARPTAEALRRFRTELKEQPTALAGGARSRDALVRRFVGALESRDTAGLREMVLSRAEFAYLYYPSSKFSRPPYELPPAILWLLIRENSLKGMRRALDRRTGEPFAYVDHRCESEPEVQGDNTLWHECTIRRAVTPSDTIDERLFGTIVEHHGRYKFVSYANDL